MEVTAAIALIQGIIVAIPAATKAVEAIHQEIDNLFSKQLITVEVQKQLHAGVDDIAKQVEANQPPPAFTVEADPK